MSRTLLNYYQVPFFVEFSSRYHISSSIVISGFKSKDVWDGLDSMPVPDHDVVKDDLRGPYPPTDGYRFFFKDHGRPIRDVWPLPDSARRQIKGWEASQEGCNKLRTVSVAKKQRSALWIFMCMRHQTIIGYHVMGSAEGRRDCVIPLYKFSESPPKVLFCDTACHCDEAGLNWLPHYFKHMKKFHDIFHGYAHVCSDVFDSRRGDEYNNIQTSLLEQCNSFLQSLRGLCKSGTTRLATFMFWIEVFVTEWNHRKMK